MVEQGITWVPLANDLIQILAILVPTIGTALAGWLVAKFGKNQSAQTKAILQQRLSQIFDRGAVFAMQHADAVIAKQGPMSTGNTRIDAFGNFVVGQAPQLLKEAGYDITTQQGQASLSADLERALRSRISAAQIAS